MCIAFAYTSNACICTLHITLLSEMCC